MKAIIDFVHNKLGVDKICSDHAIGNPRSGKVMEKCGLKFHHYGEYSKTDGSQTFKAKFYTFKIPTVQLDNVALEVVDNQYRILTIDDNSVALFFLNLLNFKLAGIIRASLLTRALSTPTCS